MTEIETLKTELGKIQSYPQDMAAVDCGIAGEGFFPGARGLWGAGDGSVSNKPVMILGHDFGAKADFDKSVKNGQENLNALTWKNLQAMLQSFGIPKEDCFFTNAIMGVRTEGSAIGKSPGYKNPDFISDCKSFLIKQIELQKPKIIIALGLHVLEFISELSAVLSPLKTVKSFKRLDAQNLAVFKGLSFEEIPSFTTNLVVITHPTYYHLNAKYRAYGDLTGINAETKMIESVLER